MDGIRLRGAIAALALTISGSALAAPPSSSAAKSAAAAMKSPPDFQAMLGLLDKLFPPQPDPDPARLALARTSVAAMWPDGGYSRMMTGMMGGIFDRVMKIKPSDLPPMAGIAAKPGGPSNDKSLHEQAAAKDPYFDQRVAAMRGVLSEEFGKLSTIIDPRVRDGLARAMARRFDAQQLTEINRFYATPAGHALASQSLALWVDPDMMRSMFSAMPEMMKLMPEIMQKVDAANRKFPKPPASAKGAKH